MTDQTLTTGRSLSEFTAQLASAQPAPGGGGAAALAGALAASLAAVVSQKLLPRRDGKGRVGAYEVLIMTAALRNLIREGHTQQIRSFMQTGSRLGMQTMEQAVEMLQRTGKI